MKRGGAVLVRWRFHHDHDELVCDRAAPYCCPPPPPHLKTAHWQRIKSAHSNPDTWSHATHPLVPTPLNTYKKNNPFACPAHHTTSPGTSPPPFSFILIILSSASLLPPPASHSSPSHLSIINVLFILFLTTSSFHFIL